MDKFIKAQNIWIKSVFSVFSWGRTLKKQSSLSEWPMRRWETPLNLRIFRSAITCVRWDGHSDRVQPLSTFDPRLFLLFEWLKLRWISQISPKGSVFGSSWVWHETKELIYSISSHGLKESLLFNFILLTLLILFIYNIRNVLNSECMLKFQVKRSKYNQKIQQRAAFLQMLMLFLFI